MGQNFHGSISRISKGVCVGLRVEGLDGTLLGINKSRDCFEHLPLCQGA